MEIKKLRQKIILLKRLLEHPETPTTEAENAKKRIAEIESKISIIRIKKISIVKGKTRRIVRRVPKEKRPTIWPGRWRGRRGVIDSERGSDNFGNIQVAWNCPGCGKIVSHTITPIDNKRIKGQSGGIDGHIKKLVNGDYNQLCHECYEKYC